MKTGEDRESQFPPWWMKVGMEGLGLGMEVDQRLRGEEGVERHIFGHSRETDWALGGAALGLTVALVEFIANSVVEVASSVASRRRDFPDRAVITSRDDYDDEEEFYYYDDYGEEDQYDYADYRASSNSRRRSSHSSHSQTYRALAAPVSSLFGKYRFDLNKLNIDYGAEGNSPWYSTPSPSPHEAFAELPPSSSSSTSFSSTPSSSSTTSSPWDRLQEMEEPLPHNFKENAFSNLAVRWGKMDVGEGQPTLLPAVPAVPGKQGVEYTFRRARARSTPMPTPINAYMGIPG